MSTQALVQQSNQITQWQSPAQVSQRLEAIQQLLDKVLKKDVDYGVIPGLGKNAKPSLWKSGSEQILAMFQIAVDPIVEDLSADDVFRFRVTARLSNVLTQEFLGSGIGEASTNETKYKWKQCWSKAEFDNTDPSRRRTIYKTYEGKESTQMQVRQEPADLANTILKMAKKRAQIDATLTVTGASSMFEQDLEDLPEGAVQQQRQDKKAAKAQAKAQGGVQGDVMCGKCRAIGSHLPDCEFAKPAAAKEAPVVEGEVVSKPATTAMIFKIISAAEKPKKNSTETYVQINAVGDDKVPFTCNVFDKKYHSYLLAGKDKLCTAEMAKNDKGYWNMVKLIEVVGVGVYKDQPPTAEELF